MRYFEIIYQKQNITKERYRKIFEVMPEGKMLLDIGCSVGEQLNLFSKKYDFVVGVDKFEYVFRIRENNIQIINGDAVSLPFKSNSFSVVVASEILEHLYDDEKCLKEIKRVLKKSGTLIVSVPNTQRLNRRILNLFGIGMKTKRDHVREYTLKEITTLLNKYNFEVLNVTGCGFKLFEFLSRLHPEFAVSLIITAKLKNQKVKR